MICEVLELGVRYIRQHGNEDARGRFSRLWCAQDFAAAGIDFAPVQFSLSQTYARGTLRGLHWQEAPHAETKFVQVLRGRIFDVAASLVPSSPQYVARELAAGEGMLIPAGLAHGFLTLSDDVELAYMMDVAHAPEAARGARFDDPLLGIRWPCEPALVSPRDLEWPPLRA